MNLLLALLVQHEVAFPAPQNMFSHFNPLLEMYNHSPLQGAELFLSWFAPELLVSLVNFAPL